MKAIYIRSLDEFLAWWPFLLQGLEHLNGSKNPKGNVSSDRYFKVLLRAVQWHDGAVVLLLSKNDKPLGYIAFLEQPTHFDVKTLEMFVLHADNRSRPVEKALLSEMVRWAKEHGYEKITTSAYSIGGAAVRWYSGLGFRKLCINFVQNV